MRKVAVYIPAKGRSRGIPGKNLVDLGGKPLVCWSIECGLAIADAVFVSTDDGRISNIAREYGATVLERPRPLATDQARVADCLSHDLSEIGKSTSDDAIIAVLQPTSPFRRPANVTTAIVRLHSTPWARSAVTVSAFASPIALALNIDVATGLLTAPGDIDELNRRSRRQQHATTYFPNGSLYLVRIGEFRCDACFFHKDATLALVSDRLSAIDVDTEDDLELARAVAGSLVAN